MLSRKLGESNARLFEMARLKDDFVSTVSHEFKTPLTSILGFLAVLLEGEAGPLNEEQKRFLGIVRGAAERLGGLVSDILDISKLEGGLAMEVEAVDLGALARESVEALSWRAGEGGVALALDVPEALPRAEGNARLKLPTRSTPMRLPSTASGTTMSEWQRQSRA